jgi:hypothetical protein
MDMKRLARIVGVICALLPAAPLHAQVATATILGNVTDSSGGAVPGATVTATNIETQLSCSKWDATRASMRYLRRLCEADRQRRSDERRAAD